jgi:hypothetical protein
MPSIEQALRRLYDYCRTNDWKGWDPYDGLNSRLFQALPFKRWRACRLAWIQLLKRSPINLRGLLSVPKDENPKGLALFARGLVALTQVGCKWIAPGDVARVFDRLEHLRAPGYDQWCWGYNFDWQGRAFFLPRFRPNAVATTFAAHAFLDRYEAFGNERDLEIARSACTFVLTHLRRPYESRDKVCFSYTPLDDAVVHNINLLIAALFARVFAASRDTSLADWARRAITFSLSYQAPDGSWQYGTAPFHGWVDHFHTCYNLLALDDCRRWLRTDLYDSAIERGLTFYLDHLFRIDGLPRFDTQAIYPIDIHAVALALIALTRFSDRRPLCYHRREKIIEWALRRMQDRQGFFYYQKRAHSFARIPYMRWAQAWMFYALALLVAPERS